MKKLLVLGLLLGCDPAHSATVYRCEDASGHLTFSASGCASDSDSSLQRADNPRPGGARPTLMAKPKAAPRKEVSRAPTVVAAKTDGCGDRLSASERRQAIIRGQVRVGMSRADVENALGQPRRISQLDTLTRYHYDGRQHKERSRLVTFDEHGCVRRR
ncbi:MULTISPECIES: DUF4124 domain-containing protein [Pseudomonas]|uniref:DUF4124 domain-containing protein n=1 Tax=Pseudomonas oryzihabitans TaxID=47885 RepID=A0A178LEA3_9PSED|nr:MULTISPECIES: DUF4124 domain-containing protein [Pseudomonas]MDC7828470.1 DUF4124 domain-containing protein [Pseudomonas benzopyrenica]MXS19919.1 DUF4124 domain-containing protein [Pseudomonas oryzihabitans]NRH43261.1 DUF4124 domain-containing protein [Pseudomonas sp. MS15a(2019)]OAN28367.1 hypothetical protein A4V15_04730 [Pseudomonas oryzihabitans]SEP27990.1 SmpA / OmlA family protein [Pseudomonas sp. Snoq117.2]